MLELLSGACLLLGSAVILFGAAGLLRLPDFYSRTHAASMTDTAGAGFLLLGMILLAGFSLVTVKLALIALFLLVTSPTSGHVLAQAALSDGHQPDGEIRPHQDAS